MLADSREESLSGSESLLLGLELPELLFELPDSSSLPLSLGLPESEPLLLGLLEPLLLPLLGLESEPLLSVLLDLEPLVRLRE